MRANCIAAGKKPCNLHGFHWAKGRTCEMDKSGTSCTSYTLTFGTKGALHLLDINTVLCLTERKSPGGYLGWRDRPSATHPPTRHKIMNPLAHWNQFIELEDRQKSLGSIFKCDQAPSPDGQKETDESIQLGHRLGVNLEDKQLRLTPSLPNKWSRFTLSFRYRQTSYRIRITKLTSASTGASRLSLDGRALGGNTISLLDDQREHSVEMQVS